MSEQQELSGPVWELQRKLTRQMLRLSVNTVNLQNPKVTSLIAGHGGLDFCPWVYTLIECAAVSSTKRANEASTSPRVTKPW